MLGVLGVLEAETCDVCGSLGPLLKGLNSHDGASLAKVPRAEVSRDAFEDIVERNECIDDCDGEVLSPLNIGIAKVLVKSSGGRLTITRLGLSSIGAIFEAITEFQCEFRLSLLRIVRPLSDATELRFGLKI